jgi:hypothetical protein
MSGVSDRAEWMFFEKSKVERAVWICSVKLIIYASEKFGFAEQTVSV